METHLVIANFKTTLCQLVLIFFLPLVGKNLLMPTSDDI